jgi:hypothetical protein
LARSSIRFWFCFAAALIAAAIADPALESASNAHWFGPGNYTDHSTLNVFPVLIAGLAFAAWHVVLRVRSLLARRRQSHGSLRSCEDALRRSHAVQLVALTLALQIIALYVMETAEQLFLWGHILGGTIWLGAPVLISLAAHAIVCAIVVIVAIRAVHVLAATTLRVILRIRALFVASARGLRPLALRQDGDVPHLQLGPVLCRIGERAPPLLTA